MIAERWGVSTTLVYDLLNHGTLPGFRLGKLWRVRLADVEAVESQSAAKPAPPLPEARDALHDPPPAYCREATSAAQIARMVRLTGKP